MMKNLLLNDGNKLPIIGFGTYKSNEQEGIDAVMKEHKLDAIIAQTNGPSWTIDWVNGDHFSGGSSSPAAISGSFCGRTPAMPAHHLGYYR